MKAISANLKGDCSYQDVPRPQLSGGLDMLIGIKASGVNRADIMQRKGLYPPPVGVTGIMGLECAGTVMAVDRSVSMFNVGDRVCALLAGGGYAEYTTVDEGSVLPIPDNMSFVDAACFPEAVMTVWANVFQRCNLQAG